MPGPIARSVKSVSAMLSGRPTPGTSVFMYIAMFVIVAIMAYLAVNIAMEKHYGRESFEVAVPDSPVPVRPAAVPRTPPAKKDYVAGDPLPAKKDYVAGAVPPVSTTALRKVPPPPPPARTPVPVASTTATVVPTSITKAAAPGVVAAAAKNAATVSDTLPVKAGGIKLTEKERELFEDLKANKLDKGQVETLINAGILNNNIFEKFLNLLGQDEDNTKKIVGTEGAEIEGFISGPMYSAF